jgi:hypothetical protein
VYTYFTFKICVHNIEKIQSTSAGGDNLNVKNIPVSGGTMSYDQKELLEFETIYFVGNWAYKKRILAFTRKTNGKTYTSPRLILDSNLNILIGRRYNVYRSRVVMKTLQEDQEIKRKQGDVIILFLPDQPFE